MSRPPLPVCRVPCLLTLTPAATRVEADEPSPRRRAEIDAPIAKRHAWDQKQARAAPTRKAEVTRQLSESRAYGLDLARDLATHRMSVGRQANAQGTCTMSDDCHTEERHGRPRLLVRVIEQTTLVDFEDAEVLFEEEAVRAVGDQLDRLVDEGGHTRLLLNFRGVCFLSGALLGRLVALQRKIGPARGRIQLCGLAPLLRDILRITHLERVFDICDDEAEALGLQIR